MRHDALPFFDRDDLIDGHIGELVDLTAGPGDHERVDFRIACQGRNECADRSRTCSSIRRLCLVDWTKPSADSFRDCADAVAIRFCADQQNFEPVVAVAAIVAHELGVIAACS